MNIPKNIEETQTKILLKSAIIELLERKQDVLLEIIEEILEDKALLSAIKEGEESHNVSKKEIFKFLENAYSV